MSWSSPGRRVLREQLVSHDSGIGTGEVRFIPLTGFPSGLKKVERFNASKGAEAGFTKWRVVPR